MAWTLKPVCEEQNQKDISLQLHTISIIAPHAVSRVEITLFPYLFIYLKNFDLQLSSDVDRCLGGSDISLMVKAR